jgi:hypothetical protein
VLASFFKDRDGILHADYLEKSATITLNYWDAFLDKRKQQLVSKRRGKLSKEPCSFKTALLFTRQPLHTKNWQMFTLKF